MISMVATMSVVWNLITKEEKFFFVLKRSRILCVTRYLDFIEGIFELYNTFPS